jgi:glycosyltransferase involved in cell wall biosynthesis
LNQQVAVCLVGAATDRDSLRAHTPSAVPILAVDSEAEAFERAAPADVVLIRPGCLVAAGWLESLQAAAHASPTTATATPLTQHDVGGGVEAFERAAAAVQAASLHLHPRIETPGHACAYVRRSAIDLVEAQPGEDFWAQCVARGLAHVLADDVLVLDPDPRPAPHATAPHATAPHATAPPSARAIAAARRALRGLRATIDARILAGPTTGTHVHVLELIAGLARTEQVRLTAIVPDAPSEHALARLNALPHVKLITYGDAADSDDRADIVHRPFQLSNAGDLSFLESLGDRLILTQQDLIAFHNPSYFPTREAWQDYRQLTRNALATADRVLFFSGHARDEALAEELVNNAHASVVHLGVDHPSAADSQAPPGVERIPQDMLLCLGTDFLHKNRVFALRILARLITEHGWDGVLVLAGPSVAHGSSRPLEQRFLDAHPHLRARVLDLGAVGEPEKAWLYEHAKLVVYPSVQEGFGLVPFEAAAHGAPCLWAPGSSLSELLPDRAAGIVPWDEILSAQNAKRLLQDQSARAENLTAIESAAAGLTWHATAANLLNAYRATAEAPPRPASATATGLTLSEDAARLVGPGGELPADVHRPLLAVATHPRIARPFYGVLRLGYRISHGLRTRGHRRR